MLRVAPKAFRVLLGLLSMVAAIALIRDTAHQGQDFSVLWRTGDALLKGQAIYDLTRDGAMVFKYPPWFAPFFIPLALLELGSAKWLWGVIQVFCLGGVFGWIHGRVSRPVIAWAVLFAFWGIWAVHAMDGQINLILLLGALLFWGRAGTPASVAVLGLLSGKIFTLFAASGREATWKPKSLILAAVLASALSVPAVWTDSGGSVSSLAHSWKQAASSGGELFDPGKVRGRDNQGFPALILRATRTPAANSTADLWAFLAVAVLLGGFGRVASRKLNRDETAVLWLGLMAAAHPLAWFHIFTFAFPLAALALDRAWKYGGRLERGFALLGIALLVAVTRKTLGETGIALELASTKAFGVLLCAAVLSRSVSLRSAVRA